LLTSRELDFNNNCGGVAKFDSPLWGFWFLKRFSQGDAALALGCDGMAFQAIRIFDNNVPENEMRPSREPGSSGDCAAVAKPLGWRAFPITQRK
jgi:hypothetical protein